MVKNEAKEVEEAAPAPFASVEELLSFDDLNSEEVYVAKWGRTVRIRALTKAQQQQLRKDALKMDGKGGAQLDIAVYERKLLQASLADFALTDEQIDKLMLKSAVSIEFLLGEINRINGMVVGAQAGMALSFR